MMEQRLSAGETMEVYFKNLSSEETSTEKLVEDLMLLVHDAEDLIEATGATLGHESREHLRTALERVKSRSEKIKEHAVASAQATDRLIRKHPYSSLGLAFGVGLLMGMLVKRK